MVLPYLHASPPLFDAAREIIVLQCDAVIEPIAIRQAKDVHRKSVLVYATFPPPISTASEGIIRNHKLQHFNLSQWEDSPMWLINARTLELEEFIPEQAPPYAILSHRWEDEEVLFRDMQDPVSARLKLGYQKIERTCWQAKLHQLEYAWVDTCCINKESSAELSEAINSMFKWYSRAARCYAYLSDVDSTQFHADKFRNSKWFTRGWTLQELLAPRHLSFYSKTWTDLGTKFQRAVMIEKITGITRSALSGYFLDRIPVCVKMSWAAKRVTTRVEDNTYCLLGLMNVNMPLLYGEGEKAFERLQEQILETSNDESIFLWQELGFAATGLLASSADRFAGMADVRQRTQYQTQSYFFTKTHRGIDLNLELKPYSPNVQLGLFTGLETCSGHRLGILVYSPKNTQYWVRLHCQSLGSVLTIKDTDIAPEESFVQKVLMPARTVSIIVAPDKLLSEHVDQQRFGIVLYKTKLTDRNHRNIFATNRTEPEGWRSGAFRLCPGMFGTIGAIDMRKSLMQGLQEIVFGMNSRSEVFILVRQSGWSPLSIMEIYYRFITDDPALTVLMTPCDDASNLMRKNNPGIHLATKEPLEVNGDEELGWCTTIQDSLSYRVEHDRGRLACHPLVDGLWSVKLCERDFLCRSKWYVVFMPRYTYTGKTYSGKNLLAIRLGLRDISRQAPYVPYSIEIGSYNNRSGDFDFD